MDVCSNFFKQIFTGGISYKRPVLTCDSRNWEKDARERLPKDSIGYVCGSAGTCETYNKNLEAFKKWSILPSRLVKSEVDYPLTETEIFGKKYKYPVGLAPIGVQTIFNPQGELGAAAGAKETEVPFLMSTASSHSIEEVAQANGNGDRWYQLYWPTNENNDITASILQRAKSSGFRVLVVTLDTYTLGWRPSDLDNAYNPFVHPDSTGCAIGFSDPVFRKSFKDEHGVEVEDKLQAAALRWTRTAFPGINHSWEDLQFLKKHWDGPIVLKGIQTVGDAKKALEFGISGIIVSNHGGRQQDGGIGSLKVLPRIVETVGDKLTVMFDSGIRGGADIVKALALGAKMVFIGRPYVYGLALGGKDGVVHVVKCLLSEFALTLHLSGIPSASKHILNKDVLEYEG